jgi:DnaJ family protein C protein 3
MNPDFSQAHFQKAKIYAQDGAFDDAERELKSFHKIKHDDASDELAKAVAGAQAGLKAAKADAGRKKWDSCVEHATQAIKVGSNSAELRELRARCETERGNVEGAYGDLSRVAALNPSSQELRVRLANLAFYFLEPATAVAELKKCLHYDPDSKVCKTLHKQMRAFDRDLTKARNFGASDKPSDARRAITLLKGDEGLIARFDKLLDEAVASDAIPSQFDARKRSTTRLEIYGLGCRAIVDANDYSSKLGAAWCDEVLVMDETNEAALVYRGEKLLKAEKWDEAVAAFQSAFEKSGRRSQDIMQRLQKAERLLKVSKRKDYYKVLGVPRDADDRAIKKAFRTAAKTAHPDVGGSEEQMAALNEAYEVLSDPELRGRYDNGDDPNDPQGGQGGNPFAHHGGGGMPFFFQQAFQQGGGFPGGGGGGQKFHFQF